MKKLFLFISFCAMFMAGTIVGSMNPSPAATPSWLVTVLMIAALNLVFFFKSERGTSELSR